MFKIEAETLKLSIAVNEPVVAVGYAHPVMVLLFILIPYFPAAVAPA
ncbi:MAG: hypothetical protein IPP52_14235 [Ignavibacteria bacterium]|nr:hypothetical protein [Ignavibacteria bacterium]